MIVEVSASQIGTWSLCQRKWAYVYVAGERPPGNASALLGVAVHGLLERLVRDGTPLDLTPSADGSPTPAEIAAQLVPLIPAKVLAVEAAFRLVVTPDGAVIGADDEADTWVDARAYGAGDGPDAPDVVVLNGFVDLIAESDDGRPIVVDYKTTKDLRYAKSAEDLQTDPAAIIYASAIETDSGSPVGGTELRWLYASTKLEGRPREVRAYAEGVRRLPTLAPALQGIVAARKAWRTPEDAPTNAAGCHAFGGCFFRDRCTIGRSPAALMSRARNAHLTNGESTMDLAAIMAEAKAKNPGLFGDAPAGSPETGPAMNVQATIGAVSSSVAPAQTTTPAPVSSSVPTVDLAALGIGLGTPAATAPKNDQAPPAVTVTIAPGADASAAAEAVAKALGDDPMGAKPAPKAKRSTGGDGETAGYLLYQDCLPLGRDVLFASEFVRTIRATGLDHRLLPFSEGRARLAEALAPLLDAHLAKPIKDRLPIVVDTTSETERAILDDLRARAVCVVIGLAR